MNDQQFRDLLDLVMVSDPWPLDNEESHERIRQLLNDEAQARGLPTWIEAYHSYEPPEGA